jgi:hypothetical protein
MLEPYDINATSTRRPAGYRSINAFFRATYTAAYLVPRYPMSYPVVIRTHAYPCS